MKTTKTVVYALALIQELAKKLGQFVQVSELATTQNIPVAYCQKVLFAMAKSGIVLSVKGQGFTLIQGPETISTLKVLESFSENSVAVGSGDNGPMKKLNDTFTSKVNATLANLTVAELLSPAR